MQGIVGPRRAIVLGLAFGPAAARAQGVALPHDLSPIGMVMDADPVVKGVLALLLLASVLTWTIGLAKGLQLVRASRAAKRDLGGLRAATDLEDAYRSITPGSACGKFSTAASREAAVSAGLRSAMGVKERAAWRLERELNAAGRAMSAGTGILATIGAVSPFVGLFGTVWGIMRSFIGISRAQTTNLAVVAPGIAEALLATAVGLVAAIPAVVIYNLFARGVAGHKAVLADAVAEIMRLLSRDLDRIDSGDPAGRDGVDPR